MTPLSKFEIISQKRTLYKDLKPYVHIVVHALYAIANLDKFV